jgi:hypothetical protein
LSSTTVAEIWRTVMDPSVARVVMVAASFSRGSATGESLHPTNPSKKSSASNSGLKRPLRPPARVKVESGSAPTVGSTFAGELMAISVFLVKRYNTRLATECA